MTDKHSRPETRTPFRAPTRWTILIVVGIGLFVGTLGVSAAVAPPAEATAGPDHQPQTLVGLHGGGPGWHEYGSVYLLDGRSVEWRESSAGSYFDVTKTETGTVLAGFMDGGYSACGPYDPPCSRTGFRIIDPHPEPRVIDDYSFPVRRKANREVHDVERLDSGEYLLTDMDRERIVAVKNGSVTWQWNASAVYNAPADPTTRDWLHINDVDVIAEGRYLVSVRNANQLLIVQRGSGVVDVINEDRNDADDDNCNKPAQLVDYDDDGDIRCGNPEVLDHQHNPQWLGGGAVLVADSGNDRVVELHRDEDGNWTPAWTRSRAGGIPFNWPRDADRLSNGNTLITDTLNRRIVEVNATGGVVWSKQTEHLPYEADRLPEGESVGGQQYAGNQSSNETSNGDVPVLSTLLVGIRAIVPSTPFWFREVQLGLTLVSTGLVATGLVGRAWRWIVG